MLTDPIADFLTRIRNANILSKERLEIPSSSLKEAIAAVLEREGFVRRYRVITRGKRKVLQIYLKRTSEGETVIAHLERISKPGRRMYVKKNEIPRVLNGMGICILSTPRGLLSGEEASRVGVGGEVLCYVW
ncbi:30S ribosomal protein S8 [Candidatus Aerophobetes bacterium]|uniref:Small ribosomal subunit protein uS8 n=1 Tax=Aerophobetes bacterium TaxID=2030807 RepID=A0A523QFR7_UNCAE|nr:MAG: 30S ribosomal protein S8 [Candidatus Aerophobetes bacterium]